MLTRRSWYGSIQSGYKNSKSINNDITLNDVKEYFSKLPSKHVQFQYKKYNSFITTKFLEHIQLDIADFTIRSEENDGLIYGLAGIDVLVDMGGLCQWKTKQPFDVINASKEIIRVIGVPKSIFSDMEGSMMSNGFVKFLNDSNIEQQTTLNHAPCAEEYIRTIKQLIHNRLDGKHIYIDRWIDELKPDLSTYNLSYHSTIKNEPLWC